jgi:NADH-quinone oxidoreductase subunit J
VIEAIIFYLLAGVLLVSASATIVSRNPVHSVLWLVLAFLNAAGLFVLIGAEFLAMILAIVYVGAVAVLFLFVVMMLDIDFASLRTGFMKYAGFGLLLAGLLAAELIFVVGAWSLADVPTTVMAAPAVDAAGLTNTQALGSLLYTKYAFIFQAAGMILLTALIGAVVLTHRTRTGVRRQNIADQVAREPGEVFVMMQPGVGQGVEIK